MFVKEMPWKGIGKGTVIGAGVSLVGMTCLGALAVLQERAEERERNRFRWTDANRWER